jgi:cell division protein FtsL
MRTLCLLALGCLAGLLFYTYDLKFKTRQLEARAQALAGELQDESDFLALMRAETGYLARPERIEEMARKDLKLEPIAPSQLVPWKAVVADGEPARVAQSRFKDGIAALIEKTSASAGAAATQ